MPRIRGRQPGVYITDSAATYKTQVDSDRFADVNFGWTTPGGALPQMPRGFKPRHVVGIDTAGRYCTATVPDVTADIWTGTATTFSVEGDDAVVYTATVTGKFGERPSI